MFCMMRMWFRPRALVGRVSHQQRRCLACQAREGPVTYAEFEQVMLKHAPLHSQRLLVGVSGGPDSLALAALLHEYAKTNQFHLIGLTVDHRLRDDSASEAEYVHDMLVGIGMDHRICEIDWNSEFPTTAKKQLWARQKRRRCLLTTAKQTHTR